MSANQEKIVRIMTYGQFRVDPQAIEQLNEIDNKIVDLVKKIQSFGEDDASEELKEIYDSIKKMNDVVTSKGKKIRHTEIMESDIIVPDVDLALNDLKKIFTGESLIKDN